MSSDINHVTLTGRLTRDSELRGTQGGSSVLTFGLAVNDRKKNPATGEWEDMAGFYDCVIFGNRANSLAQYLTKGTKVAIEGKLRWSSWEKDGVRRSKIEVIVDELVLMSGGQGQQGQQYVPAAPQTAPAAPQAAPTFSAPPQPQAAPQAAPQPAQGYPAGQGTYQPPLQQTVNPMEGIGQEDIPF